MTGERREADEEYRHEGGPDRTLRRIAQCHEEGYDDEPTSEPREAGGHTDDDTQKRKPGDAHRSPRIVKGVTMRTRVIQARRAEWCTLAPRSRSRSRSRSRL